MAVVKRISKKHRVHLKYTPRQLIPDKEEEEEVKPVRPEEQLLTEANTNVPTFRSFSPVPSQPRLSPTEKHSLKIESIEETSNKTESKRQLTALKRFSSLPSQPILSPTTKRPSETESIEEISNKTESKTQLTALRSFSPVPSQRILSPTTKRPSETESIEEISNKIQSKTQPTALKRFSSVPSQPILSSTTKLPSKTESIEEISNKTESKTLLTPEENEITVIRNNNKLNNLLRTKRIDQSTSDQFKQSSSKWKTICKIIIVILIIAGVILAAVLPPVFLLVLTGPTSTSTTTTTTTQSPCVSTTCIGQETPYHTSIATVIYPFNGNANDSTGRFAGIPNNSPTYVVQSYAGSAALLLNNPGPNQCIGIPYVDLSRQSFTIETWLYVTAASILTDYGIFSLCDFNSTCLTISLRNGRFTLSFDSMNTTNNTLIGSTFVTIRQWVHLAVVYDSVLYQQQIYVNGRIDSISVGMIAPYHRNSLNSTAIIGASQSFAYGWTFFQGRIDLFTISAGTARTACQIYNDATLTIYFPFNIVGPFSDYSVNLFNGIASNTTLISGGQIGQAIFFTSNTSYFQVQGFPEVQNVSTANPPFTFSLWVNPATSTNGGSIIHISTSLIGNGSICYDLLALTSTGALVVQLMGLPSVAGWQGPVVPKNTWTHVAVIYSQINGVRLFINAQLSITSSLSSVPYNLTRWDIPLYITLGNNNPLNLAAGVICSTGAIPIISGSYTGGIDDFRLYNRELNNEELCVLANM